MIWVLRGLAVIGTPLLVYFHISRTPQGIVLGALVGLGMVGVDILIQRVRLLHMISAVLGAIVGIISAKLLDYTVFQIGDEKLFQRWDQYQILVKFVLGFLGMVVGIRKFPELDELDRDILAAGKRRGANMKVLDTSAIIDGRVVDICETRFVTGQVVVPRFVLHELQALADGQDPVKRARGRRGLDMLARLQENPDVAVRILDKDVPDLEGVDAKVIRLARDLGARVLTTDFNLNKLAALDGVQVLNVNDLSLALKAVVLPGETMSVFVMKEGKEREQGVGYLDDGTMVVVEDGKRHISKRIDAIVTSILQTSAGRMVFTKAK